MTVCLAVGGMGGECPLRNPPSLGCERDGVGELLRGAIVNRTYGIHKNLYI